MKLQQNGFLGTKSKVALGMAGIGSIAAGLGYLPRVRDAMNIDFTSAIMERGVAFVNCANPSNIFKALSKDDLETCYYREIFLTIGFLAAFLLCADFFMKCCRGSTSKNPQKGASHQSPPKPEDKSKVDINALKKQFDKK